MKGIKSMLSIDKLTLCYIANDELIDKLDNYDEIDDTDDCFRLKRIPSEDTLYMNGFNLMIKYPEKDAEGTTWRKFGTLRTKNRSVKNNSYVWIYFENWVFYETFITNSEKHSWFCLTDYVIDELELTFNNITELHICFDSNINFAKRVKKAQFNDDYEVILNGKCRFDKEEILKEILYLQTGNQKRMKTISAYIHPQVKDGLSLRIYDKSEELKKSNKSYIKTWIDMDNNIHRVEVTTKNEHIKEYYKEKSPEMKDETLIRLFASQQESQPILAEMIEYFANRLLRFRYKGNPISIFQI